MNRTPKQSAESTRNYTQKYVDRPLLTVEDRIVAAIESDICGRRGIKNEWRHISDDVVETILEVWREIVRQEITISETLTDTDTAPHTHNQPQVE